MCLYLFFLFIIQVAHFSKFRIQSSSTVGNGNNTCKAVLDEIIAPETQANKFTWSGRQAKSLEKTPEKLAFKTEANNIINLIFTICCQVDSSYCYKACAFRLQELIKTAKSRTLLSKKKLKTKREMEKVSTQNSPENNLPDK